MATAQTTQLREFSFSVPKEKAAFFKQLFQSMQVDLKPVSQPEVAPKKARTQLEKNIIEGYKEMLAIERGELKGFTEEEFLERARKGVEKYHGKKLQN